jgi:hypothetical protein
MQKKVDLYSVELHDAFLKAINLISVEDSFDRIEIDLISEYFIPDFQTDKIKLVFNNCLMVRFCSYLWSDIDYIQTFFIKDESEWIDEIEQKYTNKGWGPHKGKIKHFCLDMNTAGKIEFLITEDIIVETKE